MKKILILLLVSFSVLSCRETEIEQLFDTSPEERMTGRLAELHQGLISASNGWKGELTTNLGGGYAFYIKFNEDNTLEMLSDINNTTASEVRTSTYRTKWVMDASLIFDTYNYISLLQDPGNKVPGAGGSSANGLQSDIEFEYVRSTTDSVFLSGKRYKNSFVLTRLSNAEQDLFLNSYVSIIANTRNFISTLKFPYIEIDGVQNKISFIIGLDNKRVLAEYIDEENAKSANGKFAYDTYALTFPSGMKIENLIFQYGVIENDKLFLVDSIGQKVEVKSNDVPILPILTTFGYNKPNRRILSDNVPGVTANTHVFTRIRELFASTDRTINTMYFAFSNSNTAIFYIGYTANSSGSSFVASATYQYRQEGDKIFLRRTGIDGGNNWNTRAAQVAPADQLFGSGDEREFSIEWVASDDPTVIYPVAAIKSVIDPLNMLYGRIGP